MTSSSSTRMDVDVEHGGEPTPEQIMEIDAEETGQEIRRRIAKEVQTARRARRPNDPLICELLVPPDLANSTFRLPAVETVLREFLPLEVAVNDLLSPQINWAPPGYKPTDKVVRKTMARLWAIRTDGDGDCLLHSVSISLWGQHDRTLVLRSLLVEVLLDKPSEKMLFRIWREGQQRADAAAGDNASFEMEEEQVLAEWRMLVEAAKTPSAYLSSFHAFVLANALRRPILVYGDRFVRGKDGEPYAPSDVRGVYLPTLLAPGACYKLPIAVGYTCVSVGKVGHFTALVGIERQLRHLPLVDEHGDNLPIRYDVPPATAARPDPEGDALEDYMATAYYFTKEHKQYRMAVLRGAYMTPEADDVRVAMGHATEAAFDRLAKAQEQEINRAFLEPKEGDAGLPPPAPVRGSSSSAPDDTQANGGSVSGGNSAIQTDVSPPLPPPFSSDVGSGPSPLAAKETPGGASNGLGGASNGLVGRSRSAITAASIVSSGDSVGTGNADGSSTEGRGMATTSQGGAGGTVPMAMAGEGEFRVSGVGAGSVAVGSRTRSWGANLDGDNGDGASVTMAKMDGGDSGNEAWSGASRPPTSAAAPQTESAVSPGTAAGSGGRGNEVEDVPGVASPPISGRLFSAPLVMLSAVGAWATGRGRSSISSDAGDAAADAVVVAAGAGAATPGAEYDRRRSGDTDDTQRPGTDRNGNMTLGDTPLPRKGANIELSSLSKAGSRGMESADNTRAQSLRVDSQDQGSTGVSGGSKVDDQGGISTSGNSPPVDVAGEGMDLDSPPRGNRNVNMSVSDVVTNGKRKPVCSPAVTPDGPSTGRYFRDSEGGIRHATAGAEELGVMDPLAAKITGSRRSKGRTIAVEHSGQRGAGSVTDAGTNGTASAAEEVRSGASGGEDYGDDGPCFVAYHIEKERDRDSERDLEDAAAAEAYHSTRKWREVRSSYSLARENAKAEQGEVQTKGITPFSARYHSRTRLPDRALGGDGSLSGRRVVRDGVDTKSPVKTEADLEGRDLGDRIGSSSNHQSGGVRHEAAAAVSPSPLSASREGPRGSYRHMHEPQHHVERTRASSSSSTASKSENRSCRRSHELLDCGLYPNAPAPSSVAEARARRAAKATEAAARMPASSSSSLSHGDDPLTRSRGFCGSSGRYADVVGGRVDERTQVRGETATADAAYHHNYRRDDADRRGNETAHCRPFRSSSLTMTTPSPSSVLSPSGRVSMGGSRERYPSPITSFRSSMSKAGSLRKTLDKPGSSFSCSTSPSHSSRFFSSSALAPASGRSSWTTAPPSVLSSTSTSYLASKLAPSQRPADEFSSHVPGAVARGMSSRGRLAERVGSGSIRSNESGVRPRGSSTGPNTTGFGGETLSSIRRMRARERQATEASRVGARAAASVGGESRLRRAQVNHPKFY